MWTKRPVDSSFKSFFDGLMEITWEEMCEVKFRQVILKIVADRYGVASPEWHEARNKLRRLA